MVVDPPSLPPTFAFGALQARVGARGMPPSYDSWSRRSSAVVALATAPALAAVVVIGLLQQNPVVPVGKRFPEQTIPYSPAATTIYLVLVFGLLLLMSVMSWGYLTLARGIHDRQAGNSRRLRLLAHAPKYLALTSFVLPVVSNQLASRTFIYHGGHARLVGGHPLVAQVVTDVSHATLILGVASAVALVVQVARRATLSLDTLSRGVAFGTATAVLLWVMTASAAALNSLYGIGSARLGSGYMTMFPSGESLALMTALLSVLATVSTFGVVLAGRSVRVVRSLAV